MRARWATVTTVAWSVGLALAAGCEEDAHIPPYLPPEEASEQAARDCAAMSCEGAQVAIAQIVEEVTGMVEAHPDLLDAVERACVAAAGAAGVVVELAPEATMAERVEQACTIAASAVAESAAGVLDTPAAVTEGCGATLDGIVACEQACACAGCPARGAEASCDGVVVGRCQEACLGTCWPVEGHAGVTCDGDCFGRCEGECSGAVDESGVCRGRCTGICDGPCSAASATEVGCDGSCDACSGPLLEPLCITDDLEGGWSIHEDASCAACSTRCVAVAGAGGKCLPLAMTADGAPDGLVEALADVWLACHRLTRFTELLLVLGAEASSLTGSGRPGSVCAGEQMMRLGRLDLPSDDSCWAVLHAAW